MNQRFQSADINRASEQYAANELYRAVKSIGSQLETELVEFGLCPEECFEEVLEVLTTIANKGETILSELDTLWYEKFNEYRRFDRKVNGEELRKAVGIVFGFAILATDSSRHPFYRRTLSEALTHIIVSHKFEGWTKTLERIFSVPLPDGWFDAFLIEEDNQKNNVADNTPDNNKENAIPESYKESNRKVFTNTFKAGNTELNSRRQACKVGHTMNLKSGSELLRFKKALERAKVIVDSANNPNFIRALIVENILEYIDETEVKKLAASMNSANNRTRVDNNLVQELMKE